MSPLSVRRYRAERLLRRDFNALRASVLASVRGRLSASGVSLDRNDLDACYALAWQGLYAAVLDGQDIASPAGWLVLVTFRRAIEEHRARGRATNGAGHMADDDGERMETFGEERDLAGELDDRARLRELFEGMRGRLDAREREAATLCYLQGLSRSEAAARLGVSDTRMRKLMEGNGRGRPGVAGKLGALVQTIRDGGWCEEQGSLMRALAYGILDPEGERYRLALAHHAACPSCRAYVVSLRGLAATLPPVFLPGGLGAAVLAREAVAHSGLAAGGGIGSGAARAQVGRGIGGGVPASGVAGGSAAGGGWLLAGGPLSAKLAAGCLLALGVGAGCVALGEGSGGVRAPARRHPHVTAVDHGADASAGLLSDAPRTSVLAGASPSVAPAPSLTPAAHASREFGPESALGGQASQPGAASARAAGTRSASSASLPLAPAAEPGSGTAGTSRPSTSSGDEAAAAREFSPG
jgi:DNA-directed RNA polymerase specialized sigma24 family protein